MVLRITAVVILMLVSTGCGGAGSAWERAKAANTVSALQSFLDQYPDTRYSSEARQALDAAVLKGAYRHSSRFKGQDGAAGIAVQSGPSGLVVFCGDVKVVADRQTDGEWSVRADPADTKFAFTLSQLEMDPRTGALIGDTTLLLGQSRLPARYRKGLLGDDSIAEVFPDAPKSSGVALRVNPAVGYTEFAGLRFTSPAIVGVRGDGIVETAVAGVRATDPRGRAWVSRPVHAGGKPSFVFAAKEQ